MSGRTGYFFNITSLSLAFLKLHQFLHGREKRLVNELQEEGKIFLQDMQLNTGVLQEKCNQAKEILIHIQSRLYHHNSISFLTGIKSFMNRPVFDNARP
ncbi:E3 ubiquitin-protein ligase TRIM69-like [Apteryx rowi]|uniref:E3 ubiquitin-protein ligase TRIM69-like n=1 Tax=Apteryx rowi TaxID=308060 RepID=UPI000E1DED73|nr:E3 ubiquitin-protein ligase TRIM69-like [Apteryx rowi]